MEWLVKNFNIIDNENWSYNVLAYKEDLIKKLKKKYPDKESFKEELIKEIKWQYWGRCEYECIISKNNDKIILSPWVGSIDPEADSIDVTDNVSFDWVGFYEWVSLKKVGPDIKIDIWDQVEFRLNDFIDYCWGYKHKWQQKPKNN